MDKIKYLIMALLGAGILFGCDPVSTDPPEFEVREKTVLVYMVANNNLGSEAYANIEDLKKGYVPSSDNLLVYVHNTNNKPVLLKIYQETDGSVRQDTVYRFPVRNSATPEVLSSVMNVTRTMFPANEYGVFLWSHGTGWLPEGHYTKSFGNEDGVEMDIAELADAIPYKLSFVVFDACLMGGIEVLYQMKDSVDYVISSPAEVLSDGFPYSKVMQHVFRTPSDLSSVAKEYFDHYNSMSGSSRSATVSLVKTSELDALAQSCAVVFEKYGERIADINRSEIQRYYRADKYWFYDLGDFIMQLAGEEDAAPVIEALDRAVIYKATTPNFLEIAIDKKKYSGLSTYIPLNPADDELDAYYRSLNWNRDVKMLEYPVDEEQ